MKTASKRPHWAGAFRRKWWQLIILMLAFASAAAQSDSIRYAPINGYGFKYKRHASDSVLLIPLYGSSHTPYRAGAIKYRQSDSSLYKWTGTQWLKVFEGGAANNGIDTVYTQGDTLQVIETPDETYYTIVNSPFTEVINDSTIVIGKDTLVVRGSGGISNANVGSGYRLLKPGTQEIKTLFDGYGTLSDSTTNTNGITRRIDTVAISTRAWRQKLADSLGAIKLNISDTSSMLTPYPHTAGFGLIKSVKTLRVDTARATGIPSYYYVDSLVAAGGGGSGDTTYTNMPIWVDAGTKDTLKLRYDETNLKLRSSDSALSVMTTATQIPYGDANNLQTSSNRLLWDNTNRKFSIKKTNTYTTPTPDKLMPYGLEVLAGSIVLGDSTSGKPNSLIFSNPYGQTNSTSLKYSVGPSGTEEFNIWVNAYYDSTGTHRVFDATKYANWIAFNPNYFLMQSQGIGYAWNDNTGSKVSWRFDNLTLGNQIKGSRLTVNEFDIRDYTTSTYQNNDGRGALFRVSSATLNISGTQALRTPDSIQVFHGSLADTGPILGLSKTGATTQFLMRNDENNTFTNLISLNKRRGASYGITQGDRMGAISFNTLNEFGTVANANTISAGTFRLGDFYWNTTNAAAATAERMRLEAEGSLLIGTATAAASSLLTLSSTTRGMLPPRMTSTQRTSISSPATGLLVFDTDTSSLFQYNGSAWQNLFNSGAGGGSSYTFANGLTETSGTVRWGGSLAAATFVNLNSNILRFQDGSATRVKVFATGETVLTTQLLLGDSTQNDATNLLELQHLSSHTKFGLYNTLNNTSKNSFRFLKSRVASFDLTNGDIIGELDFNSLGYIRAVASGASSGSFKPFHYEFHTTDDAGSTGERMRLTNLGSLGVGTTGPDRKLDILDASNPQLRLTQADGTQYLDFQVNSSGNLAITGSNASPFLAIGGITSSFAGFVRDGASIGVRVGDNSAYAHLKVLDDAYDATGWNGNITVPTKNAIRDEVESIKSALPTSAEYTPTLTVVSNLDGVSLVSAHYYRNGNYCQVWVQFTADATATGDCTLGISFPFASEISASGEVMGHGSATTISGSGVVETLSIGSDVTNNRANVGFVATGTTNRNYYASFSYKITPP